MEWPLCFVTDGFRKFLDTFVANSESHPLRLMEAGRSVHAAGFATLLVLFLLDLRRLPATSKRRSLENVSKSIVLLPTLSSALHPVSGPGKNSQAVNSPLSGPSAWLEQPSADARDPWSWLETLWTAFVAKF